MILSHAVSHQFIPPVHCATARRRMTGAGLVLSRVASLSRVAISPSPIPDDVQKVFLPPFLSPLSELRRVRCWFVSQGKQSHETRSLGARFPNHGTRIVTEHMFKACVVPLLFGSDPVRLISVEQIVG
jgi:hypothetical protein